MTKRGRAAKASSQLLGIVDGHDLARMFAWMRPNDLIWNYWVNNYLLGNRPPAFDILYWNADTTRLPAALHGDYLDLYFSNPFVNADKLTLNDKTIDMSKVKADSYVVAGVTDVLSFGGCVGEGDGQCEMPESTPHARWTRLPPRCPHARGRQRVLTHSSGNGFGGSPHPP